MPVRIEQGRRARLVESLALLGGQFEIRRVEVVAQLRLVALADDYRGDSGAPERPRKRNLRSGHVMLARNLDEYVDDRPQPFLVADRRLSPASKLARALGRHIAAVLT